MKILFVTSSYFPIVGGSEILTRVLATKLSEIGVKADILTFNMNEKWYPKWKAEMTREGAIIVFKIKAFNPFPRLPNPLFNLLRVNVIPNLDFTKKLKDYDIIHFVGEADLSLPLSAFFVKKPKILHCVGIFKHGGIYKYYMFDRPFLRNIFSKYFHTLSNKFIVYSNEDRTLLSHLGVPRERILILPLGVDTEVFQPSSREKIDNLVLFVGRIDRIKGLHILMNALQHIKVPVRLIVIGPRWNEKYAREIEQLARSINKIGFHSAELLGEVDHNILVSWYQKASVVVCPFLYETYSTVTLEALACGTPVVTSGTHINNQDQDGILVTHRDPQEIANAVSRVLENKEFREKLGREGRKLVEERFSWELLAKRLVKIYKDLLAN